MIFRKAKPVVAALRARLGRLARPTPRNKQEVETALSEPEGGGEAGQTDGQNLTAPFYEGDIQAQYSDSGTAQRQDEAQRAKGDPYLRTQVRQNWIMVAATIVIAFATVITTVTGLYQWQAIQKQLASADESSKQTDRLIKAMEKQSDASQDIAEQNKELVGQSGEQTKAMAAQADASQTQADASIAQAEAAKQSVTASVTSARAAERSARISQQAFSVGERPYVAVKSVTMGNLAVGQAPIIGVEFINSGRTPALNTSLQIRFTAAARRLPETKEEMRQPNSGIKLFMPSGEIITQRIRTEWAPTQEQIEGVKKGTVFLYVFGTAYYDDGAGEHHIMDFCALYNHVEKAFNFCRGQNTST